MGNLNLDLRLEKVESSRLTNSKYLFDCFVNQLHAILQFHNIKDTDKFIKSIVNDLNIKIIFDDDNIVNYIASHKVPLNSDVIIFGKHEDKYDDRLLLIEDLLENGKSLIINPDCRFIKFSRYYQENFDLNLRENFHKFTILCMDNKYYYYYDNPVHFNPEYHLQYKIFKSIGYVSKAELDKALSKSLKLDIITVAFDFKEDSINKNAVDCLKSYAKSFFNHTGNNQGDSLETIYGKEAINKLIMLCDLDTKQQYKLISPRAKGDLFWQLSNLVRKREIALYWLENSEYNFTSNKEKVIESIKKSAELWQHFANTILRNIFSNRTLFETKQKEYLIEILKEEEKLCYYLDYLVL
jgi:hypothetical protein